MVEGQVVSLVTSLAATGITATTAVSATKARDILRRRRYSEEIEDVATEFMQALESAIEAENERRDTKELAGVVDDWSAVAMHLARSGDAADVDGKHREHEQIDLLYGDEAAAVRRIAEAIAATQGYDLEQTPGLRDALETALTRAYREAIADFEGRIAGTDLADAFASETNLRLSEQLGALQTRLAELGADIESLLTQPARDEGFRQLTPSEFALGPDPRPERCWRIGFTLADARAGLPAERLGQRGGQEASAELVEMLRAGEDCIVVGGPGSGKSTLCKQVAVRWDEDADAGPVLYRESGAGGGSEFASVEALKEAITATDAHTLVVVEDAVQPGGNAIFEVVENLSGYEGVSFLLDDLRREVEEFEGAGPVESSLNPRQADVVSTLRRYHLPRLSKDDISRVVAAFESATGRTVDRTRGELRRELSTRSDVDIGEMMLLSFLLPVGGGPDGATGLERNVRNRYETLDPDADTALRDLSRFDPDLVADVGVMVTLLNASGIGIKPELVHALAAEYGHDWETHDEIADIRAALEGWFLYATQTETGAEVLRTTHRLWSTLYLRELATDHEGRQQSSRRRARSERRFGRCLKALFALFDDPDQRAELEREFPDSPVLDRIAADPGATAREYVLSIFELGEHWPALAALVGTDRSARYRLPDACPGETRLRASELRGHAHRLRGNYGNARTEYQRVREAAAEADAHSLTAQNWNHLGLVAEAEGDLDTARDHFEQSREIFRQSDDRRGQAMCLSNLGVVARKEGQLARAQELHERSLDLFRDAPGRHIEAACLGNLGIIAQTRGDLPTGRESLRRSLDIARGLGDRHLKAEALTGLGLVARHEGTFETAAEYVQRGLQIDRELGNRHGEAKALGIQGLVARGRGDPETARDCYDRSLALFRTIADDHGEATVLSELAMLDCEAGEYDRARERIERSRNILDTLGDSHGVAESLGLAGAIDVARGATDAGREKLADARSRFADIEAPLTELQVLRHHAEYERDRGNDERVRALFADAQDCIDRAEADLGYEQERIEACYHAVGD